jgi:hypothetical protein
MLTPTVNFWLKPTLEGTLCSVGRGKDMNGGFRCSTRNSLDNKVENNAEKQQEEMLTKKILARLGRTS